MKINTKKLKYGTAAMAITIAVIVLVVLINVIIALVSDRVNMNLDLTPNKDFAITDETKDYLASLTENVEICTTVDETTFQTSDSKYIKQAYEVLKKYAAGSRDCPEKDSCRAPAARRLPEDALKYPCTQKS